MIYKTSLKAELYSHIEGCSAGRTRHLPAECGGQQGIDASLRPVSHFH